MIEKIKKLLKNKEAMLELVRYVFAGGLTTLLSIIISYGVYMLLAADHTINGANAVQVRLSTLRLIPSIMSTSLSMKYKRTKSDPSNFVP